MSTSWISFSRFTIFCLLWLSAKLMITGWDLLLLASLLFLVSLLLLASPVLLTSLPLLASPCCWNHCRCWRHCRFCVLFVAGIDDTGVLVVFAAKPAVARLLQLFAFLESCSQIHSPWSGGKAHSGIEWSYRPSRLQRLADQYDNPESSQLYPPVRDYEFGSCCWFFSFCCWQHFLLASLLLLWSLLLKS